MSSGVRVRRSLQGSTSPPSSGGMRRIGQGILLIERNGGGGGTSGEGVSFSPLALFPSVIAIRSHPRVYVFHAETHIAAFRISSRVRAGSCGRSGRSGGQEACRGGCEE